MKKIFRSRWFAAAVMVIVIFITMPLFSAVKLKSAYYSALDSFNKTAVKTDKHGNSLMTDMDLGVQAAQNLITRAAELLGEDDTAVSSAKMALEEYHDAVKPIDKYPAYLEVNARVESVYRRVTDYHVQENEIETQYSEVLSRAEIIKRGYAGELLDAKRKAEDVITGFPASLIAEYLSIGG